MSPRFSFALLSVAVTVVGAMHVIWPDGVRRFLAKLPQWSFNQAVLDNPESNGLLRFFGVLMLLFAAFAFYMLMTAEVAR